MSCCPSSPPIVVSPDSGVIDGPEMDLRPNESIECFSKRAGNSTGALDDAVEVRLEKIENESIPVTCEAKTNVIFKLTAGSISPAPIAFELSGDSLPGVTLVGNLLSGIFEKSVHGKKLTIKIVAKSAGNIIDERTYVFSPSLCTGSNSIQFKSPLPGGIINSPFGMRFHPIQRRDKLHTGIDMVLKTKGIKGEVVAVADGVVIKAANTDPRGYGNTIHIRHMNGSGQILCTTTYNHLSKILVSINQSVMAGQTIALEGGLRGEAGSGGSTGLHLHFECKLPDGSFTDPAPFIRGSTEVAGNQISAGVPNLNSITVQSPNASVTKADVDAKQGCQEMGTVSYPSDPSKPEPPVILSTEKMSVFEKAWFFTMTFEVGPFWIGDPVSGSDTYLGKCDTPSQKRNCGYVAFPLESGGKTKFGIAQSGNPRTDIYTLDYPKAKELGLQNYWNRGRTPATPSTLPDYIAIFMFDTNYQHGDGNGRTIFNDADIGSGPWPDKASQMVAVKKLYDRRLIFANTLKVESNRKGVANRVSACYAYVSSLEL